MASKASKIKKSETVYLSPYVDKETGEPLINSLHPGTELSLKKDDPNMVKITSDDYAMVDTSAMIILTDMLNNSDIANVIKMSVITKTPLNILYNHTQPHSNESLQKYLQVKSESMFHKLIKRLVKAGILYQIKGNIHGKVRVCYMMNPFLSRKRHHFEKKVVTIFKQFNNNDLAEFADIIEDN